MRSYRVKLRKDTECVEDTSLNKEGELGTTVPNDNNLVPLADDCVLVTLDNGKECYIAWGRLEVIDQYRSKKRVKLVKPFQSEKCHVPKGTRGTIFNYKYSDLKAEVHFDNGIITEVPLDHIKALPNSPHDKVNSTSTKTKDKEKWKPDPEVEKECDSTIKKDKEKWKPDPEVEKECDILFGMDVITHHLRHYNFVHPKFTVEQLLKFSDIMNEAINDDKLDRLVRQRFVDLACHISDIKV